MSATFTSKQHSPWPNQRARVHPRRWSLKFWNPRNRFDMRRPQSVSSSEDGADSAGLELSFPARPSPCSSLTEIDSQDRYRPRRSITQSASSLAAPSRDEIDTPDKDYVSVSSCSHVARSIVEIVEREVTAVASSPNPMPASMVVTEQDYPRHSISSRGDSSFSQTSPSPGVSSIDPDVASTIPHIVVSGDTSPRSAEPSLSTPDVLCSPQNLPTLPIPEPTTRETTGRVAESSELMVLTQNSTLACTDDWSRDEKEFQECLPCGISHYARKSYIDEWAIAKFTVPAMQIEFNTCISPQTGEKVLPEGWTKHTHSDGKPYFYHNKDKVITQEWLYDTDIAEKVSRYTSILSDAILKRAKSFGRIKSWHLYVEIAEYDKPSWEGDNCCRCKYYFTNHDEECIFWLSECPLDDYLWEFRGDMNPDFIRRFLQKEYWNHQYFFSDIHPLTEAQWKTVQKYVLLAETDVTMSDVSTVTWSIDKLQGMSKNIIIAEKLDTSEVAASCMMASLNDQILNYHGERNARTSWNESVYGHDHANGPRTVPFRIANILLFYAPIQHYTSLNKVWVDKIISLGQRTALVEQTITKLNLSNGLATVLLAVNMSFLAIPSVDNTTADQQFPVTKILICFSVVLSLGSIIIGLFLISQHTALKQADRYVVVSFLERHWQMNLGFEKLAIISSVPQALLMWGITSFLVSFLSMCFEAPNPPSLKAFVILAYVLITALGLWCLSLFWEDSDQWIERFLVLQRDLFSDTKDSLHFILSCENLRRLRDKIWRTGSPTRCGILPTTANNRSKNFGIAVRYHRFVTTVVRCVRFGY